MDANARERTGEENRGTRMRTDMGQYTTKGNLRSVSAYICVNLRLALFLCLRINSRPFVVSPFPSCPLFLSDEIPFSPKILQYLIAARFAGAHFLDASPQPLPP